MWKRVICLFLILSFIITIVGCGGVPTVPSTPEPSDDFVLIQVTDPESNLIFITGKENEDAMAILGDKDTEGNPTDITGAVYVSEQGDSFAFEAGIDGLPTYLIDSEGNKVIFENYTNSTVDISIYDSSGSLIQDTTTINLDPADLLELKQLYNSFSSKQRWSNENTEFALKWGAVGLGWLGCIGSGGLTVLSGGALTPIAALACGGAIFSTITAITPTDTDNTISLIIGGTTCVLSAGTAVYACGSSIVNLINLVVEGQDEESEAEILEVLYNFDNALVNWKWEEAKSYCITGSEAYESVDELKSLLTQIDADPHVEDMTISYSDKEIINVKIEGIFAEVLRFTCLTIAYFSPPYPEELYTIDEGEDTIYLEKIGNNWKIYGDMSWYFNIPKGRMPLACSSAPITLLKN